MTPTVGFFSKCTLSFSSSKFKLVLCWYFFRSVFWLIYSCLHFVFNQWLGIALVLLGVWKPSPGLDLRSRMQRSLPVEGESDKETFFFFRSGMHLPTEIRYFLRNPIFPLLHDRLNRPTVRPVFSVEPWFVRFSHNSLIPGSIGLKNRISVQFSVFPVGPSGPVRISKPWLQRHLYRPLRAQ